MPLKPWLMRVERKYAWGFIGLLITLALGVVSIYAEFVRKSAADFRIELLSLTPVLDVRERLPDLAVLYRGADISKTGQTITVVVLRIANRGNADILKGSYDDRDPVGFEISSAELIKAEVVGTSSDYLKKATGANIVGPKRVALNAVILEPKENYDIKLLLLHPSSVTPIVRPYGKVAGVRNLSINRAELSTQVSRFSEIAFSGSLPVQFARAVVYFVLSALVILVAIGFVVTISEKRSAIQRKQMVTKYRLASDNTLAKHDPILEEYLENREDRLLALASLLEEDRPYFLRLAEDYNKKRGEEETETEVKEGGMYYPIWIVTLSITLGLLKESQGNWTIQEDRAARVVDFVSYLRATGSREEWVPR